MGKNPYSLLPKSSFWKTGVVRENPYLIESIYKKKFSIPKDSAIATAGSCFAQHISWHLKENGYNVLDLEPPPPGLPVGLHRKFGYSMYSARYGNIYTVRQLLQLAQEAAGEWAPQGFIWEKNGRYYDALRPAVEPEGLKSPDEVLEHRNLHILRVAEVFKRLDIFIFTLGLTEMWVHKKSGTVFPTAPGTLVGEFDEEVHEFQNAHFGSIRKDLVEFVKILRRMRGDAKFKMILTVSPVPLAATASGRHALVANMHSKSTLRAIAGLWAEKPFVDYFPSYEIVTNPRFHSSAFSDDLRSVREELVEIVMNHFFAEHSVIKPLESETRSNSSLLPGLQDVQCEEALIKAFGK